MLKGINAQFEDGKTNLIIGQSGSGKTVLMKNIVGLFTPEKGQILWEVAMDGNSIPPAIGKHYNADEEFCTIITPWGEMQSVSTGLGGRVIEICAQQGQMVRRGDIIAYILRDGLFD